MKIFKGVVIHTKMAKTAMVAVDRFVMHPVYKKRLKRTKKYAVHDEVGVLVGDRVSFVECAPISKTKKWKITAVNGKKVSTTATEKPATAEVKATKTVKEVKPKAVKKETVKKVAKKTTK